MLFTILHLLVFALVCLLVVLLVEWVAGMFGVPANVIQVFRAIVALLFVIYLLAVLLDVAAPPGRDLLWGRPPP